LGSVRRHIDKYNGSMSKGTIKHMSGAAEQLLQTHA